MFIQQDVQRTRYCLWSQSQDRIVTIPSKGHLAWGMTFTLTLCVAMTLALTGLRNISERGFNMTLRQNNTLMIGNVMRNLVTLT